MSGNRRKSDIMFRNSMRCGALFAAVLILGACSTMQGVGDTITDVADAINPVNWFEGDGEKADEGESKISKVEDRSSYPKLSETPDRPKISTADERAIIKEGLLADRDNARYADGPPPRLYPQLAAPIGKAPRMPVEEASLSTPGGGAKIIGAAPETIRIVTVRFPRESTEMPEDNVRFLREVVAVQRRFGGSLRVVGHAAPQQMDPDPAKDRLAKFNLSVERAKSVAAALVSLGLGRDQLLIEAKGDSEPAVDAADLSRAAENHRVEVFLDKPR